MQHLLVYLFVVVVLVTNNAITLADQNDERLNVLFENLKTTSNIGAIEQLEEQIWGIWLTSNNDEVNTLMRQGVRAMAERDFDAALQAFDNIIAEEPDFAEGWNKRATVYYLQDNLTQSMQDIQRTLELEPRHFGALSGMGLIFMRLGDNAGALEAYKEVIKIHPNSPSARFHIDSLQERIRNQMI